jgi:hypothetical protein
MLGYASWIALSTPSPMLTRLHSRFRESVWRPALKKADLMIKVRVHDLRHAHASWLLAGGADLQVVKQRLGHGSLRTTEKYFGRGHERHPEPGQLFDQGDQVALPSGEPVHLQHQQHVDPAGPGRGQRRAQTGAVGVFRGGIVAERGGLDPARLGGDVGVQPDRLGLDRIRLMLLIGGAAGVDRDPPHRLR